MSASSETNWEENEVRLFDLWWRLRNGWRCLFWGTVVGMACAVLAIMLIKPTYEAAAVIQVGQVAGQLVEPATHAVERMKSFAFQLRLAESMENQHWIDELQRSGGSSSKYLSAQLVKATNVPGANSPLIEVKTRGGSPEIAKEIADRAVEELAKRSAEIAKPAVDKLLLDVTIAKEKLAKAEKELEEINRLMASARVKDDRFTQFSLLTSLRVQKEGELFSQRQAIMALETSLIAPATQPTKVLESVIVPAKPVSPKRGLSLALGLVGGVLAGVIWVFLGDAWRRAKQEHQHEAV